MDDIVSIGLDNKKFNNFNYMIFAVNQTFTYANNSLFYSQINPTYYDYYNRVVKLNLEWYDGYVQGIHNNYNGILSTRIGSSIVNGIVNNVFSRNLIYDRADTKSDYKAINFFSDWANENNLIDNLKLLSKFSGASGSSVLKLNTSYNKVWVQPLRQDQFIYETDAQGNINAITCYMKPYENLFGKNDNYFVVEKRYFTKDVEIPTSVFLLDGTNKIYKKKATSKKAVVEYQVLHYHGQILNNGMASSVKMNSLKWYDIPSGVREIIKKDFNAFYFDKPELLPFGNSLGCFMLQLNGKDPTITTGNFGQSFLTDIRSELVEYELINAYAMRDMYNAQGQVGVPKAMTINDALENPYNAPKGNYEYFPGDPEKQKPIITQFELRADEWIKKKDDCLKKMATILGMSPKIIASYLNTAWSNSFGKTATESKYDESNDEIFLNDKRKTIINFLNPIINCILKYYGYYQEIKARFLENKSSPSGQDLKDVIEKYNCGFIDLRAALREINPLSTEKELDELEDRAKARIEEINKQSSLNINSFGDYE